MKKHILQLIVFIFENTLSVTCDSRIVYLEDEFYASFPSNVNTTDERFTLNTAGCVIPIIYTNQETINKYFNRHKHPWPCPNSKHPLLTNNRTHIWVLNVNLKHFEIIEKGDFRCCYKSFFRPLSSINMSNEQVDNRIVYSKRCIEFDNVIEAKDEFVKVSCVSKNVEIYTQYFIFTPKKPFTSLRNESFVTEALKYNIIIMGIGSMSRQNFLRSMPKTMNLLEKYGAVGLKGYNSIGPDTFQNIVAVLLGMNSSELYSTCWLHPDATLDSCPFIWERFKDVGYYTALAEDTTVYGMFNSGKLGFRGIPTDYYLHPFIHESDMMVQQRRIYGITFPICMGDRYYYDVLLNYVDNLTTTHNTSKLFGLFWEMSMSRDYLSYPMKMDNAYFNLIRKLKSSGYLDKSILIFLSDHGMNTGNLHLTKQGMLEVRQPLLYILAPKSFRDKFRLAYRNLQVNKDRLSTPYDLHKTLIDLIDLSDITDQEITKRIKESYSLNRDNSFFLPIPQNRTCDMAEISMEYCNCFHYTRLTNTSARIAGVKEYLTIKVNKYLTSYPRCLFLTTHEVLDAYELEPGYLNNKDWRDFKVIVTMTPGNGIFEAILRFKTRWTLVQNIKRLDSNTKNYCVEDSYAKALCHCI